MLENQNKTDSRVFWSAQYFMGGVWVIFGLASIITFSISNTTVCAVGALLSITNTMGYMKCDKNHSKKMSSYFVNKAAGSMSSEQMGKLGF